MPFEIVVPGETPDPDAEFTEMVNDTTVRQFTCPNCGAVIAGTNKDVYDAMPLFNRPLAKVLAVDRMRAPNPSFKCPDCGEFVEFGRVDPEHERPVPPDRPGKPEKP